MIFDPSDARRCGDEAAWWQKIGIDPTDASDLPWLESACFGDLAIRDRTRIDGAPSASVSLSQVSVSGDRSACNRGISEEMKPIEKSTTCLVGAARLFLAPRTRRAQRVAFSVEAMSASLACDSAHRMVNSRRGEIRRTATSPL
jgi:hypothetical protein